MKLHELLAVLNTDSYRVIVDDQIGHVIDTLSINPGTAPEYTGPFWSDSQRESCKVHRQKIKLYADYEVIRVSDSLGLSIYVTMNSSPDMVKIGTVTAGMIAGWLEDYAKLLKSAASDEYQIKQVKRIASWLFDEGEKIDQHRNT